MECDYREGQTEREAFSDAFRVAEEAESLGFDGVWLAERHFVPPGSVGISSVVSAPLIMATAIAGRTSRMRIGIGVLVLPLGHPVRLAEEADSSPKAVLEKSGTYAVNVLSTEQKQVAEPFFSTAKV